MNPHTTGPLAGHDHTTGPDRRRFLALGAAAGAGLLASGCGGTSGPPQAVGGTYKGSYTGPKVSLTFWNGFTGGDGPYMRSMVKDFNAAHDNIKVTMHTMQWEDYYKKVPAAARVGKGPDIGIAHIDQLATLAARRTVLPLDDVARQLGLKQSDFAGRVWEAGIYQDERYGIPLDVHALGQFWNTDVFGEADLDGPLRDRAAYGSGLPKLVDAGIEHPFWMPSLWPSRQIFLTLLWQLGGEPFSADGTTATFDSGAGVEALTWQVQQIKKGYSPANVAIDTQYNAFKTGKNAITWDGIWMINDLKKSAPDLNWDLATVPKIGDREAVWASSHNLVLMSQPQPDENKLAASKAFIDYISSHSVEWAKSGQIPARNSARESAEFTELPQAAVAEGVDTMRFLPAVPGIREVVTRTIEEPVNKAVLQQQSPKRALTSAARAANELLKENRKKFGG